MAKETIIRCNKCGKGVPLSTVDVKGKELLCLNCQTGKTILPEKKEESIFITNQSRKGKTRYACGSCSYNFYRNPTSKTPLRCPYCNSLNISRHTRTSAADLIKEIDGFDKYKFFKDR